MDQLRTGDDVHHRFRLGGVLLGLTVLSGCGDSGPQLSCPELLEAVRVKSAQVMRGDDQIMAGIVATSVGRGLDAARYCPIAKATIAVADEVIKQSRDYERRCSDSGALKMAQGPNHEGSVSRGMVKEGLCK